ncbi:septum formation initiator family protein [Agromyces mediolanus]|uniref:FtsB family cell division protein n=1 Tax=Agromyces mediolanus TaxID=41986 RepID=UPI0038387EE9
MSGPKRPQRPGRPRPPAQPAAGHEPGPTSAGRAREPRSTRARATPSASAATPEAGAVRSGWLGGIRFSGFSLIMMGLLVLAVVVLAPTISAFASQRQQIAELRAEVSQQEAELTKLRAERERWSDETFIVTQARERLYYVLPGEVSYLVIDDRSDAAKTETEQAVSAEVTEAKHDWLTSLLDSVMTAGLAPGPADPSAPPADPAATTPPAAAPSGGTR